MLSLDEIERALVIAAHPDDVDFGAAGTIANLTDLGATVIYCIVTDGQAGGFCLLYTSPSPRDTALSRMPSSA